MVRVDPSPNRGMTLIEVLVALAVVAITLAAGFKAAGGLTVNAQRLSDLTMGQWCAENQLTEIRLTRQFPGVGDNPFGCEQMGQTFVGQLSVRTTPNPNFRRVDAIVGTANAPRLIVVTTVVGRF